MHRTAPWREGARKAHQGATEILESSKASLLHPSLHSGDPSEQLVRHFLIETGPKGVKIKGCPTEPYFGESERALGGQLRERPQEGSRESLAVHASFRMCFPPLAGSLSALVSQHSISPISLPCCLRIPSKGVSCLLSSHHLYSQIQKASHPFH